MPTPTTQFQFVKGDYTIQLDKERKLRYSLRTLRNLMKDCQINLLDAEQWKKIDADKIAKVLQAGLRGGGDPTITLDMVEEWIDMPNIGYVMQQVMKAMVGQQPGDDPTLSQPDSAAQIQ